MKMVLFLMLAMPVFAADSDAWWPTWRGVDGSGQVKNAKLPVKWDDTTNIKWMTKIPGHGLATPVIWGDKLFVLTAIPTEKETGNPTVEERSWMTAVSPDKFQKFDIIALDRNNGKVIWQKTAIEDAPHEGYHSDASWASGSPVTDGKYLLAHFGSRGLFAYDLDGNYKWKVDLGDMVTSYGFGEGSSPVIHGDRVIVNWDHEGDSFIVALDLHTGKELWRKDRDEPTSWSTPAIVEYGGKTQVIVSATNKVRAYDIKDGSVIWSCSGMTRNTIPSPIVRDGMVYLSSGFRGNALMAIDLAKANGDITDTGAVVWKFDRDTPYVPGMLLYENSLYFIKSNNAILSSFDIKTGKANYGPVRLDGVKGVYASPIGADGKIYILGRAGATVVLEHGKEFKVLSVNKIDDRFDASPAVAGNNLYLRGHKGVYCIAE